MSRNTKDKTENWIQVFDSDAMYMIFTHKKCLPHTSISSFDLDDTLVTTSSGKKFSTSSTDWKFLNGYVVPKLQVFSETSKIVIFTNQKGLTHNGALDDAKCKEFQNRVESISKALEEVGVFIQVFAALEENIYRKPLPAMFDELLVGHNGGLKIDKSTSFYVGDAAGRMERKVKGKKVKKDFSCSDRNFASNLKIKFYTPEEFFLKEAPVSYENDAIDVTKFGRRDTKKTEDILNVNKTHEMVIFVGSPASGKSSFYEKYFKPNGYQWVNQDTLGSKSACLSAARKSIINNSVVIDNTNPSIEIREEYITIANKAGYQVRCVFFDYDKKISFHLNKFRAMVSTKKIPDIAIHSYFKKLELPTIAEGFKEVVKIPFEIDDCFKSAEERELFEMLF
ncbi:polynucleotide phosphatase/kinase, putative [Entamoeba invadens IP1]|uniref:Polynucleotide phosphatase/kinase, putative n=1 Tax=Entamoeba invadens IP1 TaxID=370355 RepID=A0A0A1TX20_ENTIV|nr:polynucleotide phosphatase/kinase, putative [Entamoeba invadens IP1]ELP85840.1 polynucleotide phosphatase/kinase, putative [Entamoeba invadens IP1]|eukprot:XP_004185186.1 polynucleotide phosphatase/kinase, putative [Entamoeba invadens IP1]